MTIDNKIKKFGYLFIKDDFKRIDFIIKDSKQAFIKKLPLLTDFINENYFHFGNTKKKLVSNLKKII